MNDCGSNSVPFFPAPPAPTITKSTRINGSHCIVSWDLLPLSNSRGFITHYYVVLQHSSYPRTKGLSTNVSAEMDYIIVDGLDPPEEYIVFVSAATEGGVGDTSDESVVKGLFTGNNLQ